MKTPRFKRTLLVAPGLLAAGLALTGCLGNRVGNRPVDGEPEGRRRSIEPIDLKSLSTTPPVDVAESQKPFDELIDKGAPIRGGTNAAPAEALQAPQMSPDGASVELRLEDARASALAGNLGLRVRFFDPSLAERAIEVEQARFDSTFASSVTWTDSFKENRLGGFYEVNPSINQILPTGGSINVAGTALSTSAFVDAIGRDVRAFSDDINVAVAQPLLRGGGLRVNTAPIRIARLRTKISDAQTQLTVIQTLAETEIAYWEVEAARRELRIQEDQLDIARRQLENVERLIQTGFLTRVERNRAVSGLLARRENVVVAQTNLRLRERELKRLMQVPELPVDSEVRIECATDWSPVQIDLEPEALMAIAVENRMELAVLQVEALVNDINLRLARNDRLPQVDLRLSYNRQSQGINKSTALDDLFNRNRTVDDYTIGAILSYPLGNRAARANYERARLQKLRTLASQDEQKLAIQTEILNAVDQLERDWARIVSAQAENRAAELTYNAEVDQFLKGVRTTTEVLEAAQNWAVAQIRQVRALADYAISRVFIALATGTMQGYAQVEWVATP